MFYITSDSLKRDILCEKLSNTKAGALVTFEGWVRDHNEGKKVSSLEYQIYDVLALKEGQKIIHEAIEKFNIHDAHAIHRFGHLKIKDMAIWIGVTATHRNDAYKASRYIIDQIKHRLPVWKKEHYLHHEAKWVFCKDHYNHVHFNEAEYYKKQNGFVDQEKLKNSKILVIGAGGLGCPALLSLVSAGVGEIHIIDFDKVEITNIHRQVLYHPGLVGEYKVSAAVSSLTQLNPYIKVTGENLFISSDNIIKTIEGYDLVLDCTDNLKVKYLIHDGCFKKKICFISSSVYKSEAQIRTFNPNSNNGCLRCLNSSTPDDDLIGNCNDAGVTASVVNTVGSLQANEAILYLQNKMNNSLKSTLYLNLNRCEQNKVKNFKNENCIYCDGNFEIVKDSLEVNTRDISTLNGTLIDIRELTDEEVLKSNLSNQVSILYCHRGVRSKSLVKKLRDQGIKNIYSLEGGACSL